MNFNQYATLTVGTHIITPTTTYAEDGTITVLVDYQTHI